MWMRPSAAAPADRSRTANVPGPRRSCAAGTPSKLNCTSKSWSTEECRLLLAEERTVRDDLVADGQAGGRAASTYSTARRISGNSSSGSPPMKSIRHLGPARTEQQVGRSAQRVPVHAARLLVVLIAVAAPEVAAGGQHHVDSLDLVEAGHAGGARVNVLPLERYLYLLDALLRARSLIGRLRRLLDHPGRAVSAPHGGRAAGRGSGIEFEWPAPGSRMGQGLVHLPHPDLDPLEPCDDVLDGDLLAFGLGHHQVLQ